MRWLVGVGIGSIAMLVAAPLFTRKRRHEGMTEAVNNARQIGLALFEFGSEFGKFPEPSTAAEVRRRSGSSLTLGGSSSNELFAQLLVAGISYSETMFHMGTKSSKRPDNIFNSDATILAHGECSFAYVMGLDPNGNPSTPHAFGPVIPGTRSYDGKTRDGRIAVLRLDNSVGSYPLNSAGKVIIHGLDLLDPRQPFWGGKAPDVKWPK